MSRLLAIPALATEAPAEGLPTGDYLAAAGTHELLWLLIALPLAGATVLLLGGRRTNAWGPYLAIAACVAAFLLAGPPRFLLLALDVEIGLGLRLVVGVTVVSGFACGFINPVLGAVLYERIPPALTGRVTALEGAICWSLLPFGGLLGGLLVRATDLRTALVVVGAGYLVVTLSPLAVPAWRDLDETRPPRAGGNVADSRTVEPVPERVR